MRIERSFGFVDLCGFTAFTEIHGDEEAVRCLGQFRTAVRDVASQRGVRVAKWLGDGAMFVSVGAPLLITTILEIEERIDAAGSALTLRAGMADGPVILFEGDDHIGSAVNLAARLCDVAAPHQVLATPSVASASPPWVEVEPVGLLQVPGFARPVEVVDLSRRTHAVADHIPERATA
jgi:class 3 adenylate cyclase